MAYITTKDLETFSDKYSDDESMLQNYCDSAEKIIEDYLGYSPESREYTTEARGIGSKFFPLEAKPVTEVSAVAADGESIDLSLIKIVKGTHYIALDDDSFFRSKVKYSVTYRAGYETVPAPIVTAALQIASLLWESAGGHLAVTSQSFADMGGRTFQSFKPDRFLETLKDYRLVKADY